MEKPEPQHIIVRRWVNGELVEEKHSMEPPSGKPREMPKGQRLAAFFGLLSLPIILPLVIVMMVWDIIRGPRQ